MKKEEVKEVKEEEEEEDEEQEEDEEEEWRSANPLLTMPSFLHCNKGEAADLMQQGSAIATTSQKQQQQQSFQHQTATRNTNIWAYSGAFQATEISFNLLKLIPSDGISL